MNKHFRALELIDQEHIAIRSATVNGVEVEYAFPCQGNNIIWTQENKYARSIMWDRHTGKLLSAGFPKFVNLGENPENFPVPTDITDAYIMEKMDGSLCIIDIIGGKINMRTRGTATSETLENASDFKVALAKYPNIEPWLRNHPDVSLLFEIVTPNNRIVIDYPEIDLILIGAINKLDYTLATQLMLGGIAMEMCVPRPRTFTFNSLNECVKTIKAVKDMEGVCMYLDGEIFKIKGDQYLKLHAFKSNATPKNMLRLYEELHFPSYDEMEKYVTENFDWECWTYTKDIFLKIKEKKREVDACIESMRQYVKDHADESPRDFANHNIADNPGYPGKVAFLIRNAKEIPERLIRDMIETLTKEDT